MPIVALRALGADVPRVLTDSPGLGLTAVAIALVVTVALMVGDVLGRRSVTVLDVIVIAPFFLVVGACTPIGQGIASVLGTIHVG
jgi:hypothetical protein